MMITYQEALESVLRTTLDLGLEKVPLVESVHRILAEDIKADRDFPPFNRATKDGIALNYEGIAQGVSIFKIDGEVSAGSPRQALVNTNACLEIMTGAVLPENTDTVIMYEHITVADGVASIQKEVKRGQNIHLQGSDLEEGTVILKSGIKIRAAEIAILATVGKVNVLVYRVPKVCTVATGNELVSVAATPAPHQIRMSNSIMLQAALKGEQISATTVHIADDKVALKIALQTAIGVNDVLLLSGGVSRGKYDYLPEVLEELGVQKIFHKVAQQPGKPFWFGIHRNQKTVVFSFPGNPVSTFVNYYVYFIPWLYTSWCLEFPQKYVRLANDYKNPTSLTKFIPVTTVQELDGLVATFVNQNGSGDMVSLNKAHGFVCLAPEKETFKAGTLVPFTETV